MVTYSPSDVIDISQFGYCWRIADKRWDELPRDVRRRILPLNEHKGSEVFQTSAVLRWVPGLTLSTSYEVVETRSLEATNDVDEIGIRSWPAGRPITPNELVYVCWANEATVILDWQLFAAYWDSFWYPFDCVLVFDDTLDWAIRLGQEEIAQYICRARP